MRARFWELPLDDLDREEWEALCDGCGKCCLNKLEFEDTGELVFTCISCKLLDTETARCKSYANRHDFVPNCVVLTPGKIAEISYWLPATCAYRLRFDGQPLPEWHPLLTGEAESVHRAGMSVRGWAISEAKVPEEDWEDYVIEDLA